MLSHENVKKDQLEIFLESALERHTVYLKKDCLGQEKPWTNDDVYKDWFFCNLFRRVDKTSDYIYENVIKPNEGHPYLWAAILIARWFSYIPTIKILVENNCLFDKEGWNRGIKLIGEVRAEGKAFTTAGFMLNQNIPGHKGIGKNVVPFLIVSHLCKTLCKKVEEVDALLMGFDTLEECFNLFVQAPATAGFMAYEFTTDLAYSYRYFPTKPHDYYTWCSCTVGSLRGLKRLCGVPYDRPEKVDVYSITNFLIAALQERASQEAAYLRTEGLEAPRGKKRSLEKGISYLEDISMREIEHWLCEYDKYSRIYNKEKRMKRVYHGR